MKMSKTISTVKILATLILMVAPSVTSFATLVSEDFDLYGYADDASMAGAVGGTGWPTNSPWVATGTPPTYDGGVNQIYFLNGYLNGGPGDAFTGSAFNNGSTLLAGANYMKRPFTTTNFTGSTTIWVSALASFSSTGAATAAYLMFNNVGMRIGVQAGKLTVMDGTGTTVALSTNVYATAKTHLIVYRIDFNPSGNETIQGWADPADVSSQSAMGTANVSYTGNILGSTLTSDVEVGLRGTASTDYVSIDNIRISYGAGAGLGEVMNGP